MSGIFEQRTTPPVGMPDRHSRNDKDRPLAPLLTHAPRVITPFQTRQMKTIPGRSAHVAVTVEHRGCAMKIVAAALAWSYPVGPY
jgi:hypothetical protein